MKDAEQTKKLEEKQKERESQEHEKGNNGNFFYYGCFLMEW